MCELVKKITAVAKPFGDGLRCVAAEIEYTKELAENAALAESFAVEGREIVSASLAGDGCTVLLSLSANDEGARLYENIFKGRGQRPEIRLTDARLSLRQTRPLRCQDGSEAEAWPEFCASDSEKRLIVDDFNQYVFEDLPYNLFAPNRMEDGKKYPLVMFIHDAGPLGTDPLITLYQGIGATVWAGPESQEKHPCFVLAPQFDGPPVTNDEFIADGRLEQTMRLLRQVVSDYPIDTSRIYATGQSMGGMMSCEMSIRHPEFFAGMMLVSCQWDGEKMAEAYAGTKMWILVSEGDGKAFSGMNAVTQAFRAHGIPVAEESLSGLAEDGERDAHIQRLAGSGEQILYTHISTAGADLGTSKGHFHEGNWQKVYDFEGVRDWLFAQHKQPSTSGPSM